MNCDTDPLFQCYKLCIKLNIIILYSYNLHHFFSFTVLFYISHLNFVYIEKFNSLANLNDDDLAWWLNVSLKTLTVLPPCISFSLKYFLPFLKPFYLSFISSEVKWMENLEALKKPSFKIPSLKP
jgi:hypothetical protein